MELTITTPKKTYVVQSPEDIVALAKAIVLEVGGNGNSESETFSQLQKTFPDKAMLSVMQAALYLKIGKDTLMNDRRFYRKLIKPGKATRYISLTNLADYIDGK